MTNRMEEEEIAQDIEILKQVVELFFKMSKGSRKEAIEYLWSTFISDPARQERERLRNETPTL
jgi:hypothetical protein